MARPPPGGAETGRTSHDGAVPSPALEGDASGRGSTPRQSSADHRRRRFGQDRGRLAAGRRPAGGRRPAAGHRRLHVHRAGCGRAAAAHRASGPRSGSAGRRSIVLGGLFVGTIHAYCFRLLQTHVPRYETYDVLDDHQLTALPRAEATPARPASSSTPAAGCSPRSRRFLQGVDVVENELLDPRRHARPVPDGARRLPRHARAVPAARRTDSRSCGPWTSSSAPSCARPVHADLRHLIVDEYQDVNPAQERLIELLDRAGRRAVRRRRRRPGDLPVARVGRLATSSRSATATRTWRRSRSRPTGAAARRSSTTANAFATTIPGRLPKTMAPFRPASGEHRGRRLGGDPTRRRRPAGSPPWCSTLHDAGVPYRDIAVLVRGRAAYRRARRAVRRRSTSPCSPADAPACSTSPRRRCSGRTFAWMTDVDWRAAFGPGAPVREDDLLDEYARVFELDAPARNRLRRLLREWRDAVPRKDRTADLVGELYELLGELGVRELGPHRPDGGEPARHARPVHRAARRLRVGAPAGAARRRRRRASRSAVRTGATGTTATWRSTSSTTPRVRTRTSTARPTSSSTPST